MKRILIMIMLFLSVGLFAQTGNIEVNISGINIQKGKEIRIALYKKSGFLKEMFIQKAAISKGKEINIKFENIQSGAYAIGVYQDENLDGKMNTNFIGKPKELNGFSNNAKGIFRAPKFKDASFNVFKNKTTFLDIKLEK